MFLTRVILIDKVTNMSYCKISLVVTNLSYDLSFVYILTSKTYAVTNFLHN